MYILLLVQNGSLYLFLDLIAGLFNRIIVDDKDDTLMNPVRQFTVVDAAVDDHIKWNARVVAADARAIETFSNDRRLKFVPGVRCPPTGIQDGRLAELGRVQDKLGMHSRQLFDSTFVESRP